MKRRLLVTARTRGECQYSRCGGDRPSKLGDAEQHEPHRPHTSRKEQRQSDIRIKQPPRNAIKQPCRCDETEPKIGGGYEDVESVRGGLVYASCGCGCLHPSICEGQEEEGAGELEKGTAQVLLDVCEEGASTKGHRCWGLSQGGTESMEGSS